MPPDDGGGAMAEYYGTENVGKALNDPDVERTVWEGRSSENESQNKKPC